MLMEVAKAQKIVPLEQEINEGLKEVMNRADLKMKVDMLKEEISSAGVAKISDLDDGVKEKILKVKKEIASELTKTLKSKKLDVEPVASKPVSAELKERADELNGELKQRMQEAINPTDLKNKIEALKLEVENAGNSPDPATRSKILEMKEQFKSSLAKAVDSQNLKEKYDSLKNEFTKVYSDNASEENSSGLNGDLNHGVHKVESNVGSASNYS